MLPSSPFTKLDNKTKGPLWNLIGKALAKQFRRKKAKQIQRNSNIKQNEDTSVINNKRERIRAFISLAKNSNRLHRNHVHGSVLVLSL